jgi:hypothetical protein
MNTSDPRPGEGEGGSGFAGGGVPTTQKQTNWGLFVAIALGGLVILGAVLKYFKVF